jgi:putative molybdenum carrier protein
LPAQFLCRFWYLCWNLTISGRQTGADRAGLDFALETDLEHGGCVPRGRKAEDGRIDARYNLVELSTSSHPARTRKNIEESDGTVIFSLDRLLSGGTELTWDYANKLGKPVLHIHRTRHERIFSPDSLRHEAQMLTDFLRSNKIEVLNVAGPRESKELGVYEWTLTMLRLLDRAATGAGPKSERVNRTIGRVGVGKGRVGESAAELLGQPAI